VAVQDQPRFVFYFLRFFSPESNRKHNYACPPPGPPRRAASPNKLPAETPAPTNPVLPAGIGRGGTQPRQPVPPNTAGRLPFPAPHPAPAALQNNVPLARRQRFPGPPRVSPPAL